MNNQFFTHALLGLLTISSAMQASAPAESEAASSSPAKNTLVALPKILAALEGNDEELGVKCDNAIKQDKMSIIAQRYNIARDVYLLNPKAKQEIISKCVKIEIKERYQQSILSHMQNIAPHSYAFLSKQEQEVLLKEAWEEEETKIKKILKQDLIIYKDKSIDQCPIQ